ncbi:u4/u6 small nuclear ribonucleoprotein prp31 [Anaeramoeba flamelloides]|uniref:U4/u6 small nuclear ribonucleoprotein prp31 n=1 Tax=Anaeramoeba flamelloides TaxID=1746091 RepID=A0AAV7YZ14_9EUKA|nr:u4/u6 small nuclear ribonucleoprotein prp31 [Anaeramoeba flamelloides]
MSLIEEFITDLVLNKENEELEKSEKPNNDQPKNPTAQQKENENENEKEKEKEIVIENDHSEKEKENEKEKEKEKKSKLNDENTPKDLSEITKIIKSKAISNLIKKLKERKEKQNSNKKQSSKKEYDILLKCNKAIRRINKSIVSLHRFNCLKYQKQFPDLETILQNPLDYARVVLEIRDYDDLAAVDLEKLLPNNIVMVLRLQSTIYRDKKQKLTKQEMDTVLYSCESLLRLNEHKQFILNYLASRMYLIAPNLTAIVGPTITAQLISIAGGLIPLSRISANNFQLLGVDRAPLIGFSSTSSSVQQKIRYAGVIASCQLMKKTPTEYRKKIVRLIANKGSLASRIDAKGSSPNGQEGKKLYELIEKKLAVFKEPADYKSKKPLKKPGEKRGRSRGGKKARRKKEKNKLSDLQIAKHRIAFGSKVNTDEDYGGESLGMVGSGGGLLRIRSKHTSVGKKEAEKVLKKARNNENISMGSFLAKSGIASVYGMTTSIAGSTTSLALHSAQGISLEDPNKQNQLEKESSLKYFNNSLTFSSNRKRKFKYPQKKK